MKTFMYKATVILVGLPMVIGCSLLSPAMYQISVDYPNTSSFLLPLLITLPALTQLVGLVLSSILSARWSPKPIIICGLILMLITGVLPVFIQSLTLIIILRGLLGVGLGLIMPQQTTLFAQFNEKERKAIIGQNVTINCLIGVLFFAFAGQLSEINWRWLFLLYSVFGLLIILAWIFLPNQISPTEKSDEIPSKNSLSLPPSLFVYCGYVAVVTLTGFVMSTILANYLHFYQLGDATEVGILLAVGTALSALGGLILPYYMALFKDFSLSSLFLTMTAGFFFVTIVASFTPVAVGYALLSFAQGMISCVITFKITQVVPLEQVPVASSIFIGTLFISQFLSPYFIMATESLFGFVEPRMAFYVYSAIMLILTAVSLLTMKRVNKKINSVLS